MTCPPRVGADRSASGKKRARKFGRADIIDMTKTGRVHFCAEQAGVEIALKPLAGGRHPCRQRLMRSTAGARQSKSRD